MIRIKYCDKLPGGVRYTAAKCFERLTDNIGKPRNQAEPPLRDSISKAYLHTFMGAHMVKDDWFSVVLKDGKRIPMYALPPEDRFVLAALYDSRERKNPGILLESLDQARWHFLANQEFDIWLKVTDFEIAKLHENLTGEETSVIVNYPFFGKSVEVTVLPVDMDEYRPDDWLKKYKPVSETDRGPESALSVGPDGRFYTNYRRLRLTFCSKWTNDFDKTKKMLSWRWEKDRKWYLSDITREWTADSFARLFKENWKEVHWPKRSERPWLRVPCRIITHMVTIPCESAAGFFNVWKIHKHENGSYYLDSKMEHFSGSWSIFCYAMEERAGGMEKFELLVRENHMLTWNFEIICGFKIRADCVEIYEKGLAAKMFHDSLPEKKREIFSHAVSRTLKT